MSMTKRGLVLIAAGLSVLLVACSAKVPASSAPRSSMASGAASPSVAATASRGPEVADLGDLRESFERAGLAVGAYWQDTTKLDKEAKPLFPGAPLHPYQLKVQGATVSVDRYAASDEVSRVVSAIDRKDPFPFVEFAGVPHVFAHDRVIVMFVEDTLHKASASRDSRILSVLRSELGTDYASVQ
jgi:hypothetical protein